MANIQNSKLSNTIIVWNGNGWQSSEGSIRSLLAQPSPPAIFCFQETKLHPNHHPVAITNYQTISLPHKHNSGGILICIHGSIPFRQLPDLCSGSPSQFPSAVLTIEIPLKQAPPDHRRRSFLLSFSYVHPSAPHDEWNNIHTTLTKLFDHPNGAVLIGDLNARHSDWDPAGICNQNGTRIRELADNAALSILNLSHCANEPTRRNSNSAVDLAISNRPAAVASVSIDHHIPLEPKRSEGPITF
jgi:hypothetical protein